MIRVNRVLTILNYLLCAVIVMWIFIFIFTFIKNRTPSILDINQQYRHDLPVGHGFANGSDVHILEDDIASGYSTAVVVLTHFRDGTAFFGQIFNKNPNLFYIFEPFRVAEIVGDSGGKDTDVENITSAKLLERILRCQFSEQFVSSFLDNPACVHYTKNLSSVLKSISDRRSGNPGQSLRQMCLSYKGNIAIQANQDILQNILQFLEQNRDKNLKIIHLVRDPRGVANSRKLLTIPSDVQTAYEVYLQGKLQGKPDLKTLMDLALITPNISHDRPDETSRGTINAYCHLVHRDLQLAKDHQDLLKTRYKLVRYEDFVSYPKVLTHKIYSFLGEPIPDDVVKWLDDTIDISFKHSGKNIMDFQKNYLKRASIWRRYLTTEEVKQVQDVCVDVMKMFGYKSIFTEESLMDLNVSSRGSSPLEADILLT